MREFRYENQGTNTHLVYHVDRNDQVDTMSLGMLTNNKISGLAPAIFMQMDSDVFIKYNVSAKITAKQLFGGPVNKKRLLGVFSGVVDAMLNAEEYMLDCRSILLDLDYIFTDVTTCEAELICLPILNGVDEQGMTLEAFLKSVLFTTQFDQTENCDHVAQLINYLNGNPCLSLTDFRELLQELSSEMSKPTAGHHAQTVNSQPAARSVPSRAGSQSAPATDVLSSKKQNQKPNVPSGAPAVSVPQRQVQVPVDPKQQSGAGEKKMSWFYLMQHYSKDNKAIYKAQKEEKKRKKTEGMPVNVPAVNKPAASASSRKAAAPGFAIPGQPESISETGTGAAPKAAQPVTTKACPKCGSPVQGNGTFCAACSTPSVAPAVQRPVEQVVTPSQGRPVHFGETTVLGGGIGETTVLDGGMTANRPDPHLIRVKNNERIPLNKPVFRIGKERSYVDYFISDNTAISRSHANIINRNGEFLIEDTNSTNHTYVNGTMIPSGQKVPLAHGDRVRLANEEFEFRLY